MKNILKQKRRIVGVAFLIFLSIIGTTIVRATNDWEIIWDNDEWSTPAGGYTRYSFETHKPVVLKVVLVTTYDIHLYVFNTTEYTKWSNGLYTEGYIWRDIYSGTYECILPTIDTYYVILDNRDSIITPKAGTISISAREYKTPPNILLIIIIGLSVFGIIGLVVIIFVKKKRKKSEVITNAM